MIIVSRKWTRPSTDIKFWQMPAEAAQLFNDRYKDKCLYRNRTLENNDLTVVVQTIWDSQESYDAYINDPDMAVQFANRNKYNKDNGIIILDRIIENA